MRRDSRSVKCLVGSALLIAYAWYILTESFRSPNVTFEDTWPLLIAVPFFAWWTGKPWAWKEAGSKISYINLGLALGLTLVGLLFEAILPKAIAWTLLVVTLFGRYLEAGKSWFRIGLILVTVFPWILADFNSIGWHFRVSGAHVTATFYEILGLSVEHEGTNILVEGTLISVASSCSGLRLLQLVLLCGIAIAVHHNLSRRLFWSALLILPLLAWIANTLRIILLTGVALTFGSEVAAGAFHDWSGFVVLALMFCLTQLLIYLGIKLARSNLFSYAKG